MAKKIVKDSQCLVNDLANDCISRQAAIDAFDGVKVDEENCTEYDIGYNDGIDFAVSRLSVLPSVQPKSYREGYQAGFKDAQPERIKGRWIEITLSNHTYKCSVCGRLLVNITDGKNNVAKNYPYCHCGADMRGEADE